MEATYESEKLFYEYAPDHVPQPIAWGAYASNSNDYFFLAKFHDMIEEIPDVRSFISIIVDVHRKSMGKSPNGQYGFHIETGLPFVSQDNTYQPTWEAMYSQMLQRMFVEEEKVHGKDDELERLKKDLFEKVIPRLLRPLNKTIQPCLIHTDLWPGNILPDIDTDQIMIFDSRAMWGHNECDLGTFRAPRYKLGQPYIKEYLRQGSVSEPVDDFGDRNAVYALRYEVLWAVLFYTELKFRRSFMDEMQRLIDKYPNGLDDYHDA
jgi:protein-ribulosamine 3-kinase